MYPLAPHHPHLLPHAFACILIITSRVLQYTMAALAVVPCLGCACCAASSVCSCCCSASSAVCVGRSRGSKLVYPLIILFAAVLGIVLRYHGEAALAGWVSSMRVCQEDACWGLQSNYRISAATTGFFAFMTLFTAVYPPTHVGAWAIKIAFYILLLGLSLLINNGTPGVMLCPACMWCAGAAACARDKLARARARGTLVSVQISLPRTLRLRATQASCSLSFK